MATKTAMEHNFLYTDIFVLNSDSLRDSIDIDALNRNFPNIRLINLLEKMNKEEAFFLTTIQPGTIPQKELLKLFSKLDYDQVIVGKENNDKRSWLSIAFYGTLLKKFDKILEEKLACHKIKPYFDYHLNGRVVGKHYL